MKTLVVTLFSGESEIDECIDSVKKQKDSINEHIVISGASELDAHNSMLKIFENNKENFDLYVKVDADTIVDREEAFLRVYKKLKETSSAEVELPLFDYFTCSEIMGLHFYDPKLNDFKLSKDAIFCDRSIVNKSSLIQGRQINDDYLIPVGKHCAYPTDSQSIRYGYHRGLKGQYKIENLIKESYNLHKDRARKLACIGFELAKSLRLDCHSYKTKGFEDICSLALKIFDATERNDENLRNIPR